MDCEVCNAVAEETWECEECGRQFCVECVGVLDEVDTICFECKEE